MIDAVADAVRKPGADLTEFTPTDNMQKALEYLCSKDYDETVTGLCQAVGISRQAYYLWFDNPKFVNWWNGHRERHFGLSLGKVYTALLKAASHAAGKDDPKFNPQAMKLYLERFDTDYAPLRREEITQMSWPDILAQGDAAAEQDQADKQETEQPKE